MSLPGGAVRGLVEVWEQVVGFICPKIRLLKLVANVATGGLYGGIVCLTKGQPDP